MPKPSGGGPHVRPDSRIEPRRWARRWRRARCAPTSAVVRASICRSSEPRWLRSTARLAREAEPGAWPMQADLVDLPLRRGALAAAWARASYLHVPKIDLPRALADLHRVLEVGAPVDLTMRHGTHEGEIADDD